MLPCPWAINYVSPQGLEDQSGSAIINNSTKAPFNYIRGGNSPTVSSNGDFLIYSDGWPMPESGATDGGTIIPGYTDGYVGSAPDIGCYETGTAGWQAGADWSVTPWD